MLDPLAPLDIVRTHAKSVDPALDLEAMDLEAYRRTRDFALIKCKPGREPVRFRVRGIPAKFVLDVLDAVTSPRSRFLLAFLAGCHEVVLADGTSLKPAKVSTGVYKTAQADDEWPEVVARRFGADTIVEVGRVAYERATLPEEGGPDSPFTWPG